MGFFSSRKAEDNDSYQVAVRGSSTTTTNDKGSVVQVIRSRFYGKKGKEREVQAVSFLSGVSAAQALSAPYSTSPARREVIHSTYDERPLPATPTPTSKRPSEKTPGDKPRSIRLTPNLSSGPNDGPGPSSHSKKDSVTPVTPSPRKNTDVVTVTLAQRLNELALANSEGLLNDDEYRILRQNLFERFATNAAVPIETPIVPVTPVRPRPQKGGSTPDRPASSRPLSNFQVEARPLSISSKASASSGVVDLFRRATGRRSKSKDISDNSSIWSSTSNKAILRLPRLTKKTSDSSIITNGSRKQAETMSVTSRQARSASDRGHGDLPSSSPAPRSLAGSVRRLVAPPSAFPNRAMGHNNRNTNSVYSVFEEGQLTSVKDINQEILNVEAEARRLMDAFNGLEVTTLAKTQRHHVRPSLKSADFGKSGYGESSWGDSDGRSQGRINLVDDAISMHSGASSITHSLARSAYSAKKVSRTKSSLNSPIVLTGSRPGSLYRKNSSSSVSSERKGKLTMAPPVPALPHSISHGHLKAASGSSISLVRSTGHLPMNPVVADKASTIRLEVEEMETDMDDIRRRREEVRDRYEARLEYLRAKLKGAQLREKVMRQ